MTETHYFPSAEPKNILWTHCEKMFNRHWILNFWYEVQAADLLIINRFIIIIIIKKQIFLKKKHNSNASFGYKKFLFLKK